jgi:hypothetical protein
MAKYRVWSVINPPNEPKYFPVASPEEGSKYIVSEIRRQSRIQSIFSNAFGLEIDEGFGWGEWYNEVGEDINEAFGLE